jgi:hypothetical protein
LENPHGGARFRRVSGTNSGSTAFKMAPRKSTRRLQMLGTVLLVILILVLLGALPTWPYSAGWGYYPSSGIGLVLVVVVALLLLGRI